MRHASIPVPPRPWPCPSSSFRNGCRLSGWHFLDPLTHVCIGASKYERNISIEGRKLHDEAIGLITRNDFAVRIRHAARDAQMHQERRCLWWEPHRYA